MKKRVIELSFNNHQEAFTLPINPSEFEFTETQNNQRITLLNIGEANLIGHRGLVSGSLSSFFPSSQSPFARLATMDPMEYIAMLRKWKDSTQPIRVIVSDCDFNLAMSIDSLKHRHREGDGDVYFELDLTEYRFLNVATVQTSITASLSNGLKERPNSSDKGGGSGTPTTTRSHLVVKGESLWAIAKKYYGNGAQYTKIYEANKGIIKNANLIYPGQKLVIP